MSEYCNPYKKLYDEPLDTVYIFKYLGQDRAESFSGANF